MKTKLYYLVVLLLLVFVGDDAKAQAPVWEWAKGIGGSNGDYGLSIAIDSSGNVYSTSIFLGTVDFDPGPGTFYLTSLAGMSVSKLDASGNLVWAKVIDGTGPVNGNSISLDASGNIYIAGAYSGTVDFDPNAGIFNLTATGSEDIFISKLNSSGNLIWVLDIGGTQLNAGASSMALDATGNIYTTGFFEGTVDFNPGIGIFNLTSSGLALGPDIFISKIDTSGNFIWAKAIGDTLGDSGLSIALDKSSDVYITGYFSGKPDFDPGPGTSYLTGSGSNDAFISKLDSSGNFIWAKAISGIYNEIGQAISVDDSGNVYTTGSFSETVDFNPGTGIYNLSTAAGCIDIFISKLDSMGNFVWAKQIGGPGNAGSGSSIVHDVLGNTYTSGWFRGTVDFNPGLGTFNLTSTGLEDIFIAKLDKSGNFIWAKTTGGTDTEGSSSMVIDTSDNLYLTGNFTSPTISFDTSVVTNSTNTADIFIAKLGAINTGIEVLTSNNNPSIYPNPVTNQLHLTLTKPLPPNTTITITDMQGRVVKEVSKITPGSDAIDVSILTQGVYLIKVNGQVQRFVKM